MRTLTGSINEKPPRMVRFAEFRPFIKAADGLTLSQICALSGLEPSTIQNWIKRGYAPRPVGKKYGERHLARVLLIASARDVLPIESVGELMRLLNGDADDTSDDIISEEQMYDYLVETLERVENCERGDDPLESIIKEVILDYDPPDDTARLKLITALSALTHACLASRSGQKALRELEKLKNI